MMPTELHEAFRPGTIPDLAVRLYELRQQIAALKSEEQNLTTILKEHCSKTGEVIEVEGIPNLRVKESGAGWFWDSEAVRKIQEQEPHEWKRLMELGAVGLNATVVNQALKQGQLLKRPFGGLERKSVKLEFDRR